MDVTSINSRKQMNVGLRARTSARYYGTHVCHPSHSSPNSQVGFSGGIRENYPAKQDTWKLNFIKSLKATMT